MALYFAELIDKTIREGDECNNILTLFLYALRAINKNLDKKFIRLAFEFKFMQYIGFEPSVNCCECGCLENRNFFCAYGALCENCAVSYRHTGKLSAVAYHNILREFTGLRPLSKNGIGVMEAIFNLEPKTFFALSINPNVLLELRACADILLNEHLDAKIKSVHFLDAL